MTCWLGRGTLHSEFDVAGTPAMMLVISYHRAYRAAMIAGKRLGKT